MTREPKWLSTHKRMIHELRSETCRCGALKQSGHTFCRTCYLVLPPAQRQALYRRIGQGYREAYEAACATLDEHFNKLDPSAPPAGASRDRRRGAIPSGDGTS